uniref:Leukocyte-associated Ig-like receptor 1 n=1 Tax=Mus spicilegus TaxID=10103 RepID=A0A8C6IM66_MUSSI
MSLHPVILLVLVLCLGWKINTQEGSLPDITIFPNSSLMISQGSFVTVVCSYSDKHDLYNMVRLEKDGSTFMEKSTEPYKTEDKFEIGPVNETITGHYSCIYSKGITWSERSKTLELKVIKENVIQTPAPGPTSGLPNNKRQQQRPEERLNLDTNGLKMTPDIVADDRLPEDRWTETWTPVAGDLQEVTYIQLDHHSLTQRAVGAVTSQSTDMAESSTYAAIIRR